MHSRCLALLAVVACVGCAGTGPNDIRPARVPPHPALIKSGTVIGTDPVLANFAFIGCNRISSSDASKDPLANGSTANVPQLTQTLLDLANPVLVYPKPLILFNAGDIVDNEATDNGATLQSQLAAWAKAFKDKLPVPMLAIPGNHEMLQQTGSDEDSEFPNPPTQAIWLDWSSSNGFNLWSGNGPTPTSSPSDNLMFDDSKMSYSFEQSFAVAAGTRKIHFVVVNTDTQNTVTSPLNSQYKTAAWIPLNWIKQDIAAASADPSVGAIILLGHRPVTVPSFASETPIDPTLGAELATFLSTQPKFAFYLCTHAHVWTPTPMAGTNVMQYVVGNAGSKLESKWFEGKPAPPEWQAMGGPYFGFSVVSVHQSGTIGLYHVWRPANSDEKKYYLPGSTLVSQATSEVAVFTMK